MHKFCYFLVNKIEERDWQTIFEGCIPALKQNIDILNTLLPFLIYYALRFNRSDPELISTISKFINDILSSDITQ